MRKPIKVKADSNDVLYGGFDLSLTATGIVIINQKGTVIHKAVLKSKLRGMERINYIRKEIAKTFDQFDITFSCVEGYSMGSHSGRAFDIGELGGVIKLFLWSRKHSYHLVPPTQVKRYATGKGNCQKNMVLMAVFKEWGYEARDDNEADALVLAYIARAIKSTVLLKKHQAEIILQIRGDLKNAE